MLITRISAPLHGWRHPLKETSRPGAHVFSSSLLSWASSVGALLLAAFPTDVPSTPISWHGAVHLVVAIFAFLGGAFGALYLSIGMAGNRALARARGVALPLACLAVVLCIAEISGGFVVPGLYADYGGLIERLFLGSVLLWVGAVSAVMLSRSMGPSTSASGG